VKELGVLITNSTDIGMDTEKLFLQYWSAANNNVLPDPWKPLFNADYNMDHPLSIFFDNEKEPTFFYTSSSPKEFCSTERTNSLDAIISIINNAKKFVCIYLLFILICTFYVFYILFLF
jgi:phospholipase D3/4